MDIFGILKNLGSENISTLINVLSNLFGNPQQNYSSNANNSQPPTQYVNNNVNNTYPTPNNSNNNSKYIYQNEAQNAKEQTLNKDLNSIDFSNPYWSLPDYNYSQNSTMHSTTQQGKECIIPNNYAKNSNYYQNNNFSQNLNNNYEQSPYQQDNTYNSPNNNNQNGINFAEILKVLLPLLSKNSQNITPKENAQETTKLNATGMDILKLKKVE